MGVPVKLDDLSSAFEWVSAGESAGIECEAYVSRAAGTIHWVGEEVGDVDEDIPEDIEDGSLYIAVPRKDEFDLGSSLALRFAEENLPDSSEQVYDFFRSRGAYSNFKSLLARVGKLEDWYRYEEEATENALREWCEENGFTLVK